MLTKLPTEKTVSAAAAALQAAVQANHFGVMQVHNLQETMVKKGIEFGNGSQLEAVYAGEASHMFFGDGMGKAFLGVLATHPPLEERIRAIDPGWDGNFKQVGVSAVEAESSRKTAKPTSSRSPFPPIPGMPGARAGEGRPFVEITANRTKEAI